MCCKHAAEVLKSFSSNLETGTHSLNFFIEIRESRDPVQTRMPYEAKFHGARTFHAKILCEFGENLHFWGVVNSQILLWLQNGWKPTPQPIYPQNGLFKHFQMNFVDCVEIASLLRKIDDSELGWTSYVRSRFGQKVQGKMPDHFSRS